jgi:hypothetical protein
MSNHTPGPWGTDDGAEVWPMEGPTSFVTLARVTGPWSDSQWYGSVEEGRANGRLIAAAPELLDALKDCCHRLRQWIESDDDEDMEALVRARALIEKIEGVQP